MMHPLEDSYVVQIKQPAPDAIIMLGGGLLDRPDWEPSLHKITPDANKRLMYILYLAQKYDVPIYLSGGNAKDGTIKEADFYKDILVDLGIDADRIFTENQSRNTMENASNTVKLLPTGIRTPWLVTSAYHMDRSLACFSKADSSDRRYIPAPCDFKISYEEFHPSDLLPSVNNLRDSVRALSEYMGLLYYKIRYGIT